MEMVELSIEQTTLARLVYKGSFLIETKDFGGKIHNRFTGSFIHAFYSWNMCVLARKSFYIEK
jgi:hypothetical protein